MPTGRPGSHRFAPFSETCGPFLTGEKSTADAIRTALENRMRRLAHLYQDAARLLRRNCQPLAVVTGTGHQFPVPTAFDIPLQGPTGEPVDLVRTITSHGVADLPPGHIDEEARTYTTTVALSSGQPRTILIREGRSGFARVEVEGRKLRAPATRDLTQVVRQILNLDEDLAEFYALVSKDPELRWAADGAGRMLRTPTVLEAVVKTVCTTNVAWSATVRMVTALVENLGEAAGSGARAFPTADAMAAEPEGFYREVVRAGYRSAYLRALAVGVAEGTIELEDLAAASDVPDDEVATRLLALPGIGPYGAAHLMMLLGRHSRLILDSWTRPKYARLNGRKASDATIERRFRRYGPYAGLAFWLYLTRDWVVEPP
jgi:3-methyladenine DNA glycosylase/8-oxoguanine DNA glycosylase